MKLTLKSKVVLINLLISTHPSEEMRKWMLEENPDFSAQEKELVENGLIEVKPDGTLYPTKKGIAYFNNNDTLEVKDLIERIKNVVPKNPSFKSMASNLTDTAVMGAIYTLLGEIGRRGEGDAAEYWQEKIKNLQAVLTDATPDTLWERHQAQQNNF